MGSGIREQFCYLEKMAKNLLILPIQYNEVIEMIKGELSKCINRKIPDMKK